MPQKCLLIITTSRIWTGPWALQAPCRMRTANPNHNLNSVNFRIFWPKESILNLHSSVCKTFEIIKIDSEMVPIPWDSQRFNQFYDFCVGDCVGVNKFCNKFLSKSLYIQQQVYHFFG